MRKHLLTLILALAVCAAWAQVPNTDFENWDSIGGYENPDGWTSSNNGILGGGGAVQKDTGYSGLYAAKVSTTYYGVAPMPHTGLLTNGDYNSATGNTTGGSPFSYIPDSIRFVYKYTSPDTGFAQFLAVFFNNADGNASRDTVAAANFYVPRTTSFIPVSVPVFRTDSVLTTVDSVLLVFFSSSKLDTPSAGSLWIDNISFGGPIGILDAPKENIAIDIFPNPVNDYFVARAGGGAVIKTVTILTLDGRRVRYMENLEQPDVMKVSTDRLEKGIYVISIEMADGNITRRMVTVVR